MALVQSTVATVGRYRLKAEVSLDAGSLAANACTDATFTVTGLTTDMVVSVHPLADITANVGIVSARVSAANTLKVRFVNPTGSPIDPAAFNALVLAY